MTWRPDDGEAWKGEAAECPPDCDGSLSLVLPFLDGSSSFVNGWEACSLWVKMEAGQPTISGYFHSSNDEMLLLMASRKGYRATVQRYADAPEWSLMEFVHPQEEQP